MRKRRAKIESVMVLEKGETPWDHKNPGELPGPWGDSAQEALTNLQDEADLDVEEYWERDGTLWVIAAQTRQSRASSARRARRSRVAKMRKTAPKQILVSGTLYQRID